MQNSGRLRAILQALLVTFLWSTSWVLIKIAINDIPPLTFAGLRYTLAVIILLPGLRKHRDKVRLDAVRAAREKAEAMATELGATLKSVKTINEHRGPAPYVGSMYQNRTEDVFGGPERPAASFSIGQISITASVEVVFILADTELEEKE